MMRTTEVRNSSHFHARRNPQQSCQHWCESIDQNENVEEEQAVVEKLYPEIPFDGSGMFNAAIQDSLRQFHRCFLPAKQGLGWSSQFGNTWA